MSWSVNAEGEAYEVAEKLVKDFSNITYLLGPEKQICESAHKIIAETLAACKGTPMIVSAQGHAGKNGENDYQNLNIYIRPKL